MALYRAFQAFRPEKSKQALIPALPYDVMNSDEAKEIVKDNRHLNITGNIEDAADGTTDAVDETDDHHGLFEFEQNTVHSRLGNTADQSGDRVRTGNLFEFFVLGL